MGISNVYSQAKSSAIAAIKSNLVAKGIKKAQAEKPGYLKMTGSIFNAPESNNNYTLTQLNTSKSLIELTPITPTIKTTPKLEGDIPDDEEEGKSSATKISAQTSSLKAQISSVESRNNTVRNINSNALRLDQEIEQSEKTFQQKLKYEQNELKRDNQKLDKLNKETNETLKEVDDAQHELDTLLATNSFSIGGNQSYSNNNQNKINELQTFIGSKIGVMQANGKQIYSLQRNQSRTLTKMRRNNTQFIKTHNQNSKAMETQKNQTNKVIDIATTAEGISQMVQTGGTVLKTIGQAMIAAGSSGSILTAWMIPVGQIMEKVGTVAETIGQYGQTAANIVKTAAYAAEGNLAGAMQSAAAAVQSGAAAVQSTQNIKSEFGKIDAQAKDATNKLAAKTAAKDAVKGMSEEQLGGMSKKEMRKAVSANLQDKMNKGELNAKELYKEIRARQLTDENFKAIDSAVITSRTDYSNAVTKAGGSINNGVVTGLDKAAKKKIRNSASTGFKNIASTTTKKSSTNLTNNINKFSKNIGSMAQMYQMFGGGSSMNMGSMGMNIMGGYNRTSYMNNSIKPTSMTDKERRAAWQKRNAKSLSRSSGA